MNVQRPRKHVLVIGGIREIHDGLLARECRLSWFIKQGRMLPGDQDRSFDFMLAYQDDGDPRPLIEVASAIDRSHRIDAVCAFHDEVQLLALAIARELGLEYDYDEGTIRDTRDKYRMRQLLTRRGLSKIAFGKVDSVAEIRSLVERHPAVDRFIIKPIDGTGSENVTSIERARLAELDDTGRFQFPLLMEEFVDGTEYSVEALTHNGRHHILAITEKFKEPGTFMESGHLIPARLEPATVERIRAQVEGSLDALNVTCGPTHTEVIVNGTETVLVETHTRTGGDKIPLLVQSATGIDYYDLIAAQAVGEPIEDARVRPGDDRQYAAIRFLIQQPRDEPIARIDGLEEAKSMPGVEKLAVSYHPGDRLPPVRHSFDRAAWVMAVAGGPDEAVARAEAALARIKFVF